VYSGEYQQQPQVIRRPPPQQYETQIEYVRAVDDQGEYIIEREVRVPRRQPEVVYRYEDEPEVRYVEGGARGGTRSVVTSPRFVEQVIGQERGGDAGRGLELGAEREMGAPRQQRPVGLRRESVLSREDPAGQEEYDPDHPQIFGASAAAPAQVPRREAARQLQADEGLEYD
jgi:hypothetical protein